MKRAILFFNLVCAVTLIVSAQTESHVKQPNSYVVFMANSPNDSNTRLYYKEESHVFFINDCVSFFEIVGFEDSTKDTIRQERVTIQIVSQKVKTLRTKPLNEYFKGLIKYGMDAEGKHQCECSGSFDKILEAVTLEGRRLRDFTHKWVVCCVQVDGAYVLKTRKPFRKIWSS